MLVAVLVAVDSGPLEGIDFFLHSLALCVCVREAAKQREPRAEEELEERGSERENL